MIGETSCPGEVVRWNGDTTPTTGPSHTAARIWYLRSSCFRTATSVTYRPRLRQAHNSLHNNCFEHPCSPGSFDDYNRVGRSGYLSRSVCDHGENSHR